MGVFVNDVLAVMIRLWIRMKSYEQQSLENNFGTTQTQLSSNEIKQQHFWYIEQCGN